MARLAFNDIEMNALHGAQDGEVFFRMGLAHSTGRTAPVDRVSAHKWFNLAVARGYRDAAPYRQEVAAEMDRAEIAEALRQARAFLALH